MQYTASDLRQNIFRVLDGILESGVPVEIKRRGKLLRIVPVEPPDRLSQLEPHPGCIRGEAEDIVHMDWQREWRPNL